MSSHIKFLNLLYSAVATGTITIEISMIVWKVGRCSGCNIRVNVNQTIKAELHDTIFLSTCNATLLLRDVKLSNTCVHCGLRKYFSHIKHSSLVNIS